MSSGHNSNSISDSTAFATNNQVAFTSTSLSTPPASTSTAKLSAKHQQQFTFQLNSNGPNNSTTNTFKLSSSSTSSLASINNELNNQYSNMPINPFEETNRFRLEQSVLSPNLFHVAHTSTPERDTKSLWNIDQRAVLYPADIPTDESSLIAQYVYDYKLNKQLSSAVEAFWTQNKIIIESPLTNSVAGNALRQKFAAAMNSNNKTTTASGSANRHVAANAATAKKNSYSVNSPFGVELKNSCSSANRYAASASSTSSAATSYRTSNMTTQSTKSLAKSSLASNKHNQSCQTMLSIPSNFDLSKISALKAFMLPDDDYLNDVESPNKQQLNNSIRKKLFDHNSDDLSSASTTTTATQHFEVNTLPKPEFYSNHQNDGCGKQAPTKITETNENNCNNKNEKLKPIVSSSSSTNDWRDSNFEIDDHQFASSPYDKYTNIIHDIGDFDVVDDLNDSVFMPTSQHRAPAPDLSPLLATPKKQNNYFHLTGDKSSNKNTINKSPGEKLLGSPDLSPIKLNMNELDDGSDDVDVEGGEKKLDNAESRKSPKNNQIDDEPTERVNNHNYQNGTSSKSHRSKTKKINYEDIFNHSANNGASNKSIIFMDIVENQSNSHNNFHHPHLTHTSKQTNLHGDEKHHLRKKSIENLNRMEEDETNSNHIHRRDSVRKEHNEDFYDRNSTHLNNKKEHLLNKSNDQSSMSTKQQQGQNQFQRFNKSTSKTVNQFMENQQNKLIETIIETTSTFNQDSQDTGYQTTTSAMGANGNNSSNSGSSSSCVQSFINTTNTNNSNFNNNFHQHHLSNSSRIPSQTIMAMINNSNFNKVYSIFDSQMFKSLNQQAQAQQNTVTSTPMSIEEDEWQFLESRNQSKTNNNLITSYFNLNTLAKTNTKSSKFQNDTKMLNLSANRHDNKVMNNNTKFKKSSSLSLNSLETIQPVESSTPEKIKMSFQRAKLNEFKIKFLKANGVNLVSSADSTTLETRSSKNKTSCTRFVKSKSTFSAFKEKKSNDSNGSMNDENHLHSKHYPQQAKSINEDDAYMSFNNSFECNSIDKKSNDCYNNKHVLTHNKNLINSSNEIALLRMNKSSVAEDYFIDEDLAMKKQEIDSSFVDQSILHSKISPSQYAMNIMAKAKQDLNESFKYALESKSLSTTTLTTKSSTSTNISSETRFTFF